MALHCASTPRFHLHSFKNGLLLGTTLHLRLHEFTRAPMRRRLNTMVATCSFQPAPPDTFDVTHSSHTAALTYVRDLLIAELDPATAKTAIGILGPFLSAFGFLFILRIVMSWYPKLPAGKFPYVVAYTPTEPILSVTRMVIPPIGGVDVTPVVWFGLISFLNEILVGPQGLLVPLSQQILTS